MISPDWKAPTRISLLDSGIAGRDRGSSRIPEIYALMNISRRQMRVDTVPSWPTNGEFYREISVIREQESRTRRRPGFSPSPSLLLVFF